MISAVIFTRAYTMSFLIFLCLFFSISSGCTRTETPKKVSLYKRSVETPAEIVNEQGDVLHFGVNVMLDPKKDVRIYTPFLRYLEKATGKRFHLKFTEKYGDTIENLGNGVTHFAAIGPLGYVIGREKFGYGIKYLVSGVNQEGDPRSNAVIFTRPESRIQDMEDLRGKSFAFGSKISTQGHLIPRKMLNDAGITLEDLGDYVYTGSHINTVRSVLNGESDAGCISDTIAEGLIKEGKIKIIMMSVPHAGSLIAYNGAVDSQTVEAVRSALLDLEPSGKQKDMLIDWEKTGMALGFSAVNEYELYKIAVLARKYGLLTK